MSTSIAISAIVSFATFIVFFIFQLKFNMDVRRKREKFLRLFEDGKNGYKITTIFPPEGENYLQIDGQFDADSDLNKLVSEINEYVRKSKGTTDFSVIQNKTERLEEMRYDDSTARMSFPIYLGLMGTFCGVFLGILSFLYNICIDSVNDDAIKGLLVGVLVSMSTSFIGLLLSTRNNYYSSDAKRKVDVDKNQFYDFIQTELMPSLDVSMVSALNKLHDTVTQFEPSFNRVINSFQTTFDGCTRSFGDQFAQNVQVVSKAVAVMGENMDKINENIRLQTQLLSTIKSNKITKGLQAFVEATEQFTQLTASLNKFEQARRMMLRATDEVINMQNQYSESLKIPKELVIRINSVFDRITTFENSINALGADIAKTQMFGNDVMNDILEQITAIKKKGKIADKYLGLADGKLEDLYQRQTAAIGQMTNNYEEAIKDHIRGFDKIIEESVKDFQRRHEAFKMALDEKFNITEVQQDFSNLKKLENIDKQLQRISTIDASFNRFQKSLNEIKDVLDKIRENASLNPDNNQNGERNSLFDTLFGGQGRKK